MAIIDGLFPRIHFVEPYHSFAMQRPVEAIRAALGCESTVGERPDPTADVNYHMPFHTLISPVEGKHVVCYTHTNPGHEAMVATACANADHVIAMSFTGRRELMELGVPAAKITVANMGTDIKMRPRRIGVMGTEQPNGRKRSHLLLDLAWAFDLTGFQFSIVGRGWETVVNGLRTMGVSVTHQPEIPQEAVQSFYDSLDLFLVTGYREGGPQPLLEAMAAGVPVLSPKVGYAADFVPDASCYRDVADLASRLQDWSRPIAERAGLAQLSTWAHWAEVNVGVLEDVAGESLRAPGMPRRYKQLDSIIDASHPASILEVGTWNGDRALAMIQRAARYRRIEDVRYDGYDLWEEATPAVLQAEFSKQPPQSSAVMYRLWPTRASLAFHTGDTKQTLAGRHEKPVDLIFIDGGHAKTTIARDWLNLKDAIGPESVVVFDDYYGDADAYPELAHVGCQTLVNGLDPANWNVELLPVIDRFPKPWGELAVQMAKVVRR